MVGFFLVIYVIVCYDLENDYLVCDVKGFMEKVGKGEVGLLISEISVKWLFDGYIDLVKSEVVIFCDVFKKGDVWFNIGDLMCDIGFKYIQFVDCFGDIFCWKGENVFIIEVENVFGVFDGVEDVVVYGVEIFGINGCCGMVVLCLVDGVELDCDVFVVYFDCELLVYVILVFLCLLCEVEIIGIFKYKKIDFKCDVYDFVWVSDKFFVRLFGSVGYQLLDVELYQVLQEQCYCF